MTSKVLIHEENKILQLTINRPEVRNALDIETYTALTQALESTLERDDLHAIILTGSANYFTAGNDIRDFQKDPPEVSPGMLFLSMLNKVDIPLIAAVEGGAVGIGVTMLLHCDFVFVGHSTRLQMPFVPLSLCPEGASSLLLAQYVGIRKANEWLYRGKPFSAKEAYESGLISALTEDGAALKEAQNLAQEFAASSLFSLKSTKALLKKQQGVLIDETLKQERQAFRACLRTEQAQAKFKRFFEK